MAFTTAASWRGSQAQPALETAMWETQKDIFRPDQLFNVLAIGLLTECVLLLPLVVFTVLEIADVIDFVQKPVGIVLVLLGAVTLSRVISSFVGLVMVSTVRPAWDRNSRGWRKLLSVVRYAGSLISFTYRRAFFGVSSRLSERKDVVDEILYRDVDEFGAWARKSITDALGLDLEPMKDDSRAKDNLLWTLYIAGQQLSVAKPVRDDVEGFDLSANFQARLAIVLHLGFWLQAASAARGADTWKWELVSALAFALLARMLGSDITNFPSDQASAYDSQISSGLASRATTAKG